MKMLRASVILFLLLYLGFVLWVNETASSLPARVATHFGISGDPDGWMSRAGYTLFTSLFGLGLSAFTIGLGFVARFFPASKVNLPNRDYWLAPERRSVTNAYVLEHCLWLACLEVAFVGGMHYLILLANSRVPVHMSGGAFLAILGTFFAGLAVWIVSLVLCFRKPA